MDYPHIAARVFNSPLLISRAKLDSILSVMAPKFWGGAKLEPNTPQNRHRAEADSKKIAIIPIYGTLVRRSGYLAAESGLTSYVHIESMLNAALEDPEVKGILLDIDSPGGEVGGLFDLADKIFAAREKKTIWAVANEEAFSAAYAIAAAAEKIFVPRTGGVGSVGVIAVHVDQTQYDAQMGVKYTPIFSGAKKNDFSPHEPLADEARNEMQAEIDRIYQIFAGSVARWRSMEKSAVIATEAGLFFGETAVSVGFADHVGTLDDALLALSSEIVQPTKAATPIAKEMTMVKTSQAVGQDDAKPVDATGENSPTESPKQETTESPAKPDAAQVERGRILAIQESGKKLRAPAEVVSGLVDSGMSVSDANAALIEWKSKEEAKTEIISAVGATSGNSKVDPDASVEQRAETEYNASKELQAEFRSLQSYVSYRKNSESGNIRSGKK